jgi:hypothetical protein
LREFIYDEETGDRVAFAVNGEVFRALRGGEKIATVHQGNLFDLDGKLVGRLIGKHVFGRAASTPLSFKNLLNRSRHGHQHSDR